MSAAKALIKDANRPMLVCNTVESNPLPLRDEDRWRRWTLQVHSTQASRRFAHSPALLCHVYSLTIGLFRVACY